MRKKDTTSDMIKRYMADALLFLLASKPFCDVTIGEICAKASVNRSTYYRHFNNKEDVAAFYYDMLMRDYFASRVQIFTDPQESLRHMFSYFMAHKEELLLLHRNNLALHSFAAVNRYFPLAISEERRVIAPFEAAYYTGGMFQFLLLWYARDMKDEPQVLAKTAMQIATKGLKSNIIAR